MIDLLKDLLRMLSTICHYSIARHGMILRFLSTESISQIFFINGRRFPLKVALVTEDSLQPAIWVMVTFSVIQGIDNYFVTPYSLGGEVSLSALSNIVSIICGGFLWGIAGMILFIPMLSVAKIIFDHVETLKPYGYLIGNPSKESNSLHIKKCFNNKFSKTWK